MGFVSSLYKAARVANSVSKVTRPRRAARRAKNVVVGKALARAGFWRWLWGK